MTSTSQVTASQPARAPEAATGGPRSARGSARRASGSAAWPGGLAPAAPGPSGEAFTTVLARHRRHAAEARVRAARDKSADDAALDEEREAARPDDEALGAFAAPIDPALPAASEQGIGVLSVGQGEAVHALGVPGAAAPAPDSLEPGSPAVRGGIGRLRGAGSGRPSGESRPGRLAIRCAGASRRGVARRRRSGSAIGPASRARRGEPLAPRCGALREGAPGSPSPARENAPDASGRIACRVRGAPDRRRGGGRGCRPRGAGRAGARRGGVGGAAGPARRRTARRGWRAAVVGRSWSGRPLVPARAGGRTCGARGTPRCGSRSGRSSAPAVSAAAAAPARRRTPRRPGRG